MKSALKSLVYSITFMIIAPIRAEEIIIATGEYPPFISSNMPEYGQYSKKIAMIFKEAGYQTKFVFLPWKRAYAQTVKGQYVATFSWYYTPQRATELIYPKYPFTVNSEVAFYKKSRFPNGLQLVELEDVIRKKLRAVGIIGYWYEEQLKLNKGYYHGVVNSESALRMLESNRADVFIDVIGSVQNDIRLYLGADSLSSYAHSAPLKQDGLYVLFSKNHLNGRKFMKIFDAAFERLKSQGRLP